MATEERLVKVVIQKLLEQYERDIVLLGGQVVYLRSLINATFNRLTYDEALKILNEHGGRLVFGDDIGAGCASHNR